MILGLRSLSPFPATPLQCASGDDGSVSPWNRSAAGAPGPDALLGRRILIVEDEAMVALEIDYGVQELGGEVIGPAYSLENAQELVDAHPDIDGAILDVNLGGKDVYPVAHILQLRGVPFLFHTGHGSPVELMKLFPSAGVYIKPAPVSRLLAQLATMIGGGE